MDEPLCVMESRFCHYSVKWEASIFVLKLRPSGLGHGTILYLGRTQAWTWWLTNHHVALDPRPTSFTLSWQLFGPTSQVDPLSKQQLEVVAQDQDLDYALCRIPTSALKHQALLLPKALPFKIADNDVPVPGESVICVSYPGFNSDEVMEMFDKNVFTSIPQLESAGWLPRERPNWAPTMKRASSTHRLPLVAARALFY